MSSCGAIQLELLSSIVLRLAVHKIGATLRSAKQRLYMNRRRLILCNLTLSVTRLTLQIGIIASSKKS